MTLFLLMIISMGTSENDQVSKIGKLGLIDGNLVIIATKFSFLWPSFSTIFWKYMIQTSYQKFVQSKLVFHYNSFLCRRRCLYLQKSSDSKMFCDQKKLGRYDDQFFFKMHEKYMIQMNFHLPNLYFKKISYCARDGTSISKNNNQIKNNLVIILTIFPKNGNLVTKHFAVTRFLEIEAPPFAQKGIRTKYKFWSYKFLIWCLHHVFSKNCGKTWS